LPFFWADPFHSSSCTAVRIPTLRAHSEAIVIETEKPVTPEGAREVLGNFPGLKVVDDTSTKQYPMPLTATNHYDVEVGRIRQNIVFGDHGLELFVCGDQVRFRGREGGREGGGGKREGGRMGER